MAPDPERPLVSVVMPVYNACRTSLEYLRAAVRSVCAQTYPDFELIVVDDGSTDGTRAVCHDLAREQRGANVRIVAKEHGGQSSARNAGIASSRGELVSFLDQDDLYYPDKLERVVRALGPGTDLVYTDADTIDAEGRVVLTGLHRTHRHGWPHPKTSLEEILFANVIVMPGLMTARRDLLVRIGGFDETLSGYEDDDLYLRIFLAGRIGYLPESTLQWRRHEEAYSLSDRHVRSRLRYWEKLLAEHASGDSKKRRAGRISMRFFRESLRQAAAQRRAGNELWRDNLEAAETIAPHLPAVERLVVGRRARAWCRLAARSELARRALAAWWRLTPTLGR